MVLPLLLALLFGLIEMSWAFAQVNDIRYGAREGARTYAVEIDDVGTIGAAVCDRMDIVSPSQNVSVVLTPDVSYAEGSVGALATITVTADLQTITGFYDFLLAGKTISSTVEFRIEQPSSGTESAWWTEAASGSGTHDCS